MKILSVPRWLKNASWPEILTAGCIALLIFILAFLGCVKIASIISAEVDASPSAKGFSLLLLVMVALIISCGVGMMLGTLLATFFTGKKLEKAVPANEFLKSFGIKTAMDMLHFVRIHKLDVYRCKEPLDIGLSENVECRFEALFPAPGYPSYFRDKYFAANVLCFDADKAQAVKDKILSLLVGEFFDDVHVLVDAKAAEQLTQIKSDLKDVKMELRKTNLRHGHWASAAKHRLFMIAQLYMTGLIRTLLLEKRERQHKYTTPEINNEYARLLDEDTRKLLTGLKTDADHEKLQEHVSDILRATMPEGTINWGGKEKRTLEKIIEEIKIAEEKRG